MKKVAHIKFNNGSKYEMYIKTKLPKLAKEANDYLYLKIIPEKGRGEPDGYYMNIYDANNLIWVLTSAILEAEEQGLPSMPEKEIKERKLS